MVVGPNGAATYLFKLEDVLVEVILQFLVEGGGRRGGGGGGVGGPNGCCHIPAQT